MSSKRQKTSGAHGDAEEAPAAPADTINLRGLFTKDRTLTFFLSIQSRVIRPHVVKIKIQCWPWSTDLAMTKNHSQKP